MMTRLQERTVDGLWQMSLHYQKGGEKNTGKSNKSVNEVFHARKSGMYFGNV